MKVGIEMSVATQTSALESLYQRYEALAERLNNFKNTYLSFESNNQAQVEPVVETPVAQTAQTTQVSDSLINDIMSDINFDTPAVEQAPVAQTVAPVQPVSQPTVTNIDEINIDDIMANLDLSDATMTH